VTTAKKVRIICGRC